ALKIAPPPGRLEKGRGRASTSPLQLPVSSAPPGGSLNAKPHGTIFLVAVRFKSPMPPRKRPLFPIPRMAPALYAGLGCALGKALVGLRRPGTWPMGLQTGFNGPQCDAPAGAGAGLPI